MFSQKRYCVENSAFTTSIHSGFVGLSAGGSTGTTFAFSFQLHLVVVFISYCFNANPRESASCIIKRCDSPLLLLLVDHNVAWLFGTNSQWATDIAIVSRHFDISWSIVWTEMYWTNLLVDITIADADSTVNISSLRQSGSTLIPNMLWVLLFWIFISEWPQLFTLMYTYPKPISLVL